VTSLHHENVASGDAGQIIGPIDEGRKRRAGGQSDSNRRHRGEIPPLDYGISEVGCADHDRLDRTCSPANFCHEVSQRGLDAVGDVVGRWGFDGPKHRVVFDQDGIGIRAAHVDTDSPHPGDLNTDWKSRS
jgi:hypothetical protein